MFHSATTGYHNPLLLCLCREVGSLSVRCLPASISRLSSKGKPTRRERRQMFLVKHDCFSPAASKVKGFEKLPDLWYPEITTLEIARINYLFEKVWEGLVT